MKDPFEIIIWAMAIGLAWIMLTSMTGIDDWIKSLLGSKSTNRELRSRINALERRVAELERKP